MIDPFEFLGLEPGADERAVKRAYARQLKLTRPESDPAGFQTLNEAYRRALEWVRARGDSADRESPLGSERAADVGILPFLPEGAVPAGTDGGPSAVEPASPLHVAWTDDIHEPTRSDVEEVAEPYRVDWDTPVGLPSRDERLNDPHERFDFPAFFAALSEKAAKGDTDGLRTWLQRQPTLWSLAAKTRVAHETMAALYAQSPPMPEHGFDAVLAFFDLDHVLSGQDALMLGRLRRRLHVEWLLHVAPHEFAGELQWARPPVELAPDRLYRLLSGPFLWRSVLLQALPPNLPSQVAAFLHHLQAARVRSLPPAFDRRRVAFWLHAGNRDVMSWPRAAVGLARCLVSLLLCAALDGMLTLATGAAMKDFLSVALFATALWGAFVGWKGLSQWQGREQEPIGNGRDTRLRLAFIPALCLTAVAMRHSPVGLPGDAALIGSALLAALAVALAIMRYRRRAGSAPMDWRALFGGWRWILVMVALKSFVLVGALFAWYADAGAAIAGTLWLADLWKQRTNLRLAA